MATFFDTTKFTAESLLEQFATHEPALQKIYLGPLTLSPEQCLFQFYLNKVDIMTDPKLPFDERMARAKTIDRLAMLFRATPEPRQKEIRERLAKENQLALEDLRR